MRYIRRKLSISDGRRGMVLLLVLVIVMMLSFAAYSFSGLMLAEYSATAAGLTHRQRLELADSGIELSAVLVRRRMHAGNLNISTNAGRPFELELSEGKRSRITLLREMPGRGKPPQFGLMDESAKLNINALPLESSRRKEARGRLIRLPGISVQVADAILDWMDADDEASEFGAETSYYSAQNPARRPRQGPFRELAELLQVRGINADLLYGEDQNNNGLLDPEENDGDRNWPADNRDGALQRGLTEYVTLWSCEGTELPGSRRKINLNQPVLANLYDQLESTFGPDGATYLVAWRMRGAVWSDEPRPDAGEEVERRRLERLESLKKRLTAQLSHVDRLRPSLNSDQTRRGGLLLSDGPMEFGSLLELFGGQVRVSLNGKDALLQSPWPADPVTVRRMLPIFEQMLTTTDASVLSGRINVNEASMPVLKTIPGMTEAAATAIASIQNQIQRANDSDEFSSVAWLVSRGLVSMAELRAMGPYITTQGSVCSGISVGQTSGHAPLAAISFVVDCSRSERRILYLQDLPVMSPVALGLSRFE